MKICLAFLMQNEEHWLKLHMPVWAKAVHSGFVCVDGGSTDESKRIARSYDAMIFERPFNWDFRDQLNFMIEQCENAGYDALVRLDPDELMFPDDISLVIQYLNRGIEAIMWPTVNFEKDRRHYMPDKYPDFHWRAWHLNKGVRYEGRVHIGPDQSLQKNNLVTLMLPNVNLYHYEGLRTDPARRLKHVNYARLGQGLPALAEIPPGDEGQTGWRDHAPYPFLQPLDPDKIGLRAPFGPLTDAQETSGGVTWNKQTGDIK
jgi:hypothetical protein